MDAIDNGVQTVNTGEHQLPHLAAGVPLTVPERTRLFQILRAHNGDALTAHRLAPLIERLIDWPEEWESMPCTERACRLSLRGCSHRVEPFDLTPGQRKIVEEILTAKGKANQITVELLSLVEKFAPALLPDEVAK